MVVIDQSSMLNVDFNITKQFLIDWLNQMSVGNNNCSKCLAAHLDNCKCLAQIGYFSFSGNTVLTGTDGWLFTDVDDQLVGVE